MEMPAKKTPKLEITVPRIFAGDSDPYTRIKPQGQNRYLDRVVDLDVKKAKYFD